MPKNIDRDLSSVSELLRRANDLINPMSYKDQLTLLMNKQNIHKKAPKCYLSLATNGRDNLLFPICNITGAEDPKFIKFSLKMANKLRGLNKFDQVKVSAIIKKLENLNNKFSKDIPKPADMAFRKGETTKNFNIIDKYIKEKIRPND